MSYCLYLNNASVFNILTALFDLFICCEGLKDFVSKSIMKLKVQSGIKFSSISNLFS